MTKDKVPTLKDRSLAHVREAFKGQDMKLACLRVLGALQTDVSDAELGRAVRIAVMGLAKIPQSALG